jgi:hypothetical protein
VKVVTKQYTNLFDPKTHQLYAFRLAGILSGFPRSHGATGALASDSENGDMSNVVHRLCGLWWRLAAGVTCAVLFGGQALAASAPLSIFTYTGNQYVGAGSPLFSASVDFSGTISPGSYFLYTNATAAGHDVANNGGNYGVINLATALAYTTYCTGEYSTGSCATYNNGTAVSNIGVLKDNPSGRAGSFTVSASGYAINTLSFGYSFFPPSAPLQSYYFETGDTLTGAPVDYHIAQLASGATDASVYTSNAQISGANKPVFSAAATLPEIDGGALWKGVLLVGALMIVLRAGKATSA